jgi:hypothetical protein
LAQAALVHQLIQQQAFKVQMVPILGFGHHHLFPPYGHQVVVAVLVMQLLVQFFQQMPEDLLVDQAVVVQMDN